MTQTAVPRRLSCLSGRILGHEEVILEPLDPDLPDTEETERRRQMANESRKKVEEEQERLDAAEVLRVFLAAKAML